jgi:hypothetical protein
MAALAVEAVEATLVAHFLAAQEHRVKDLLAVKETLPAQMLAVAVAQGVLGLTQHSKLLVERAEQV